MRRFTRFASLFAVAASGLTVPAVAHAAPAAGTGSSSAISVPAVVNGLVLKGAVSARDGGMYYAFQNASGNDYTVVKQKADKTFDSTFAGSGAAAVTGLNVASQSLASRRFLMTSDLNGRWWAVSAMSTGSGPAAQVSVGTATSATIATAEFTYTTLAAKCAAAYPSSTASSWMVQNVSIAPKRTSGAWMTFLCSGTGNVEPLNGSTLIALNNDLTIDTSITPIGFSAQNGSTSTCVYGSSVIADPTGPSGSPALWVMRIAHNKQTNGVCDSNGLTAAQVTGYDVLQISSTGTVTRRAIASAGDATDAQFAGRLDPGGRLIVAGTSLADTTKLIMARIDTDGTLDTTIGVNGFKTLAIGAAPAGAAVVRASVAGLVTTADTVYVVVSLYDQPQTSYTCSSSNQVTFGWRMAMVSLADGYATGFGNGGIGTRQTANMAESSFCSFSQGGQSVASDGTPRLVSANGTGFAYHSWQTLSNATGGTDGGTGTGGYTKDTGGAPSLGDGATAASPTAVLAKLPSRTIANNAYAVLTSAKAKSNRLVTITPTVCLGAGTYVITVAVGTCTVQVRSIADNSTLRTLRSAVVAKGGTAGATATATSLSFKSSRTKLTAAHATALAALASKVSAAKATVVVGYAASLTDNQAGNEYVARNRAKNVTSVLAKASPKATITTLNMGIFASQVAKKTEKAQSEFRRATVWIIP